MKLLRTTLLLCLLICTVGWANEKPLTFDRIHLSASASEEVDNDTLVAVMYAQVEDKHIEVAANKVNQLIKSAIDLAKGYPMLKHQTLAYTTTPLYSKSSIVSGATVVGWRVRQSVQLKGQDMTAMGKLVGQMQQQLALQSITYSISTEKRRDAEEGLIKRAMDNFRQRAALISNTWGAVDFRLVEMHINTRGEVAPRPYRAQVMAMEMKTAEPAVFEAGSQRLEVNISGTIELKSQ